MPPNPSGYGATVVFALVLVLSGCQRALGPDEAKKRFAEITSKGGSYDHKEMRRVLEAAFPKGTLESDHEELLLAATKMVTDPKELPSHMQGLSIDADRIYIWDVNDHVDGAAFLVFTGGDPKVIIGSRVLFFDW